MCDFQIDYRFFNSKSSTIKTKQIWKWNATLIWKVKRFDKLYIAYICAVCVCVCMRVCVCVCYDLCIGFSIQPVFLVKLSRLMTKPTKWHVRPAKTQISLGIRPVWSESSLYAQWVDKDLSFLHADSEDSDQTGRLPRLIWVFAGCTCHFVVFVMRWLNCLHVSFIPHIICLSCTEWNEINL